MGKGSSRRLPALAPVRPSNAGRDLLRDPAYLAALAAHAGRERVELRSVPGAGPARYLLVTLPLRASDPALVYTLASAQDLADEIFGITHRFEMLHAVYALEEPDRPDWLTQCTLRSKVIGDLRATTAPDEHVIRTRARALVRSHVDRLGSDFPDELPTRIVAVEQGSVWMRSVGDELASFAGSDHAADYLYSPRTFDGLFDLWTLTTTDLPVALEVLFFLEITLADGTQARADDMPF